MLHKIKQVNKRVIFFPIILILVLFSCEQNTEIIDTDSVIKKDSIIKKEVKYSLEKNLLDSWFPRIVDKENGGYYTKFNYKWELVSAFPKMIVTQSRPVWVASKAAQRYSEKTKFKKAAHHGFKFLKNKMWDDKYGGFFFKLPNNDSTNNSQIKRAYGNAFAIYALTEYYRLTGDEESKKLAKKTFRWMDKAFYDSSYGGYFDFSTRRGVSYAHKQDFNPEMFPDNPQVKYKDYNSTIHIMEAFSSLYRVWPNETLKQRLQEIFHIVRDTMVNETGYLNLNFEEDWELISFKDSSRKYIKEHHYLDNVSFGHDIETAYLLLEAGEVLNLNNDKTHRIAKSLVNHTLNYGFDKNYAGLFYSGYYFKEDKEPTIIDNKKSWWPQAEGLNGLLLFSYLYPEKKEYKSAFYNLWHYTKKYIIDQRYGGWYNTGLDVKGHNRRSDPKAWKWKSCYHSYRALENLYKMLKNKEPIVGEHKKNQ